MKNWILSPLFFLISLHSLAQSGEASAPATINTDRPGEGTDSPFLVPGGTIQFEHGLFLQYDQPGTNSETKSFSIPTGLLRFGLLPNLEFRVGYGYLYQNNDQVADAAQGVSGFDAISLGTKIFITEQKNLLPQMSLITSFTLPGTGQKEFQSNYLAPTIRLLAGHSVNDWLGITTNFDLNWDDELTRAIFGYAISFDYSFSEKWGGFTEFYGYLQEANENEHLFNAGLLYLINPDLQLDASAGYAFSENAPDFFVSAGIAFRLDIF